MCSRPSDAATGAGSATRDRAVAGTDAQFGRLGSLPFGGSGRGAERWKKLPGCHLSVARRPAKGIAGNRQPARDASICTVAAGRV
ncbi:MAG: hypothetical protein D6753_18870, partial [Planctomycetota bacterium]